MTGQLKHSIHKSCIAAGLALTAITATSTSAKAQFFPWEWGQPTQAVQPERQERAHLVAFSPSFSPNQIIVSFSDRRLYYIVAPGRAISYPIAAPRPGDAWRGVLTITQKRVNPSWTPTAEMRAENPRLPAFVPGGHPQNPMGSRALYLGSTLYRIHGTDAPWTIGRPVSRGCIRMFNEDVNDLYRRVDIGTKVTTSYKSYRARHVW